MSRLRLFVWLIISTTPAMLTAGEVEDALKQAGENRAELQRALDKVPEARKEGMVFLITNMPIKDLRSLKADFLLENVELAYRAKKRLPWGKDIPKEIFLNNVLPYANVDEERHPWRKELFEMCLPMVKECKTPAEAAHLLNSKLFHKLKVRYSTKRKKPHQSPKESIEQGMASCTGLSILLSDACRSVSIPARLVGTPLWSNKWGNHTWLEIWDQGWHFTGACEPDPNGLDRGWFVGSAAQARKDHRLHAIYAASFRKTETTFPLVWAPRSTEVFAENVTDRYTKKDAPKEAPELSEAQSHAIRNAVREYFQADPEKQAAWKFPADLDALLREHEDIVRDLVWKEHQLSPIHADVKKDFEKNQVRFDKHLSPYAVKEVGKRPEKGWPLFIAMHGGGNAPQAVNDSQWKVMQRYYRDQESVTGYQYLALRAPNNTWNGFYDSYVPPLIVNLIRQFLLFGDVDSDKVYLMGYSHGGYGAFYIGPKIPHRFAAVHASAAAPTDGTINPKTLRSTRFTFMIGERDTRYGRRTRCEAFAKLVEEIKKESPKEYPVEMEFKEGYGHGGLPDRDKIKEMYEFTRDPAPKHVTWAMTDPVNRHFFWLTVPEPAKGKLVDATVSDNVVALKTENADRVELWLDRRLVDLSKPVKLVVNGEESEVRPEVRLAHLCESLAERGDPRLAFVAKWVLEIKASGGR